MMLSGPRALDVLVVLIDLLISSGVKKSLSVLCCFLTRTVVGYPKSCKKPKYLQTYDLLTIIKTSTQLEVLI